MSMGAHAKLQVQSKFDLAVKAKGAVEPFAKAAMITVVPVAELLIDKTYQRRISRRGEATIKRIISDFVWSRFGALSVSRADGGYAIIDGQHRAIAAVCLGLSEVPCVVSEGDAAGQALDFVGINQVRTAVGPVDKFRALVAAGDEKAVELDELLTDLEISTDVALGYALAPRQTRAISRLQKVQKLFGKGTLFTALEMLLDAQPETPDLLTALMIEAVTGVTHRVIEAEGDIDRLARVFEDIDPIALNDNAGELVKMLGGNRTHHALRLLLKDYNKGLRKPIEL